jgi:hypothetical protein
MYDLLLGPDPTTWPLTAYLNLPLIPISLIWSRLAPSNSRYRQPNILPLIHILLDLSVSQRYRELLASTLAENSSIALPPDSNDAAKLAGQLPRQMHGPLGEFYPPSPLLFSLLIFPGVRYLYKKLSKRISSYVLGSHVRVRRVRRPPRAQGQGQEQGAAAAGAAAGAEEGEDGGGEGGEDVNADNDANMEMDDDQLFVIRIRPMENEQAAEMAAEAGADIAAPNADAGAAAAAGAGAGDAPQANANANALAAAGQIIEIRASSIGRQIGGALLIPWISSKMGSFLYYLAQGGPHIPWGNGHSRLIGETARNILSTILGIRGKWAYHNYLDRFSPALTFAGEVGLGGAGKGLGVGAAGIPRRVYMEDFGGLTGMRSPDPGNLTFHIFLRALIGGVKPWSLVDPVWYVFIA